MTGAVLGLVVASGVDFGDDPGAHFRAERGVGIDALAGAGDGAVCGVRVGPHGTTVHHEFRAREIAA